MAAEASIDKLSITISASSGKAAAAVERLEKSLAALKGTAAGSSLGVNSIAASIGRLQASMAAMKGGTSGLSAAVAAIKRLNEVNNLNGLAMSLREFSQAAAGLQGVAGSLAAVKEFGKSVTSLTTSVPKLQAMDLTGVAEKTQNLVTALKPLTNEMIRAGAGVTNFGEQMKYLTQAAKTANSAGNQIQKATKSFSLFNGTLNQKLRLGNLALLGIGIDRASDYIGRFMQKSNQYVEDLNLFTVSMSKYADSAYEYAQRVQDLMGIDAGQFMRNQGIFMSIASGFGVASDQAALMSKNLTQLSYDAASFYNTDVETAFQKFQSGIAGELEPLRRWGYALDQATLQQVAYSVGIQKSLRDMNQAEKSQIRYIAMMQQSSNVMHDMARTLNSPANQMRIFSAQIDLLGRSLGNVLVPIAMKVVPYMIAFTKVLRMAADAVAKFLGFTLPTFDYDSFKGGVSGAGDLTDGLDDVAGGAGKAAKAVRYLIGGFDELNVLPEKVEADGSALGGIGAGGGGFSDLKMPEYDFLEGLEKQADKLIPKMKALAKMLGLIAAALVAYKLINGVKNLAKWFGELAEMWRATDKPAGKLLRNLIAIAGAVLAFGGGFIAGQELYKAFNDLEFSAGKLAIGIGLAAAGVAAFSIALWPVLGPVGILVGSLIALTGAAIGYVSAQWQIKEAELDAEFFGRQGIAIDTLVDSYVAYAESVRGIIAPITESKEAFESNKSTIEESANALFGFAASSQGLSAEMQAEFVPRMMQAFTDMYDAIDSNIDLSVGALTELTLGMSSVLEGMNVDVGEVISTLYILGDSAKANMTVARQEGMELFEQYKTGIITFDELSQGLADNAAKYSGVSDKAAELSAKMDELKAAESDINWSSTEQGKAAIERLGDEVVTLQQEYEEAKKSASTMFDDLIRYQDDPNLVNLGESVKNSVLSGFDTLDTELDTRTKDLFNQLGTSLNAEVDRRSTEFNQTGAGVAIDLLEGAVQAFVGSPVSRDMIHGWFESWKQDIASESIQPLIDELDTQIGRIGAGITGGLESSLDFGASKEIGKQGGADVVDSVAAGAETASPSKATIRTGEDVVDGLSKGISDNLNSIKSTATNLGETVTKEIGNAFTATKTQGYGKTAVDGLVQGITTNQGQLTTAVSNISSQARQKFQTELAAGKTQPYGRSAAQGVGDGIRGNQSTAVSAATSLANAAKQQLQNQLSSNQTRSYGVQAIQGVASGIRDTQNTAVSALTTIGSALQNELRNIIREMQQYAANNPITIRVNQQTNTSYGGGYTPKFASGGVISGPTVGLMGEYPGAAANPEIVTPQNIMYETVAEANGDMVGVLGAYLAQANALLEKIAEKDTSVVLGDEEVAAAANRGNVALNKVSGRA